MLSIYNQKRKQKNIKNNQQGFTLVEVMIVLGIGAAIIALALIVVPTVLRNQRDTSRESGVTQLHAALIRWSNTRNGALPANEGNIEEALAGQELAYYGTSNAALTVTGATATATGNTGDNLRILFWNDRSTVNAGTKAPWPNQIHVFNYSKCKPVAQITQGKSTDYTDDTNDVTAVSSARAFAIVYALEGENIVRCVDNT